MPRFLRLEWNLRLSVVYTLLGGASVLIKGSGLGLESCVPLARSLPARVTCVKHRRPACVSVGSVPTTAMSRPTADQPEKSTLPYEKGLVCVLMNIN